MFLNVFMMILKNTESTSIDYISIYFLILDINIDICIHISDKKVQYRYLEDKMILYST